MEKKEEERKYHHALHPHPLSYIYFKGETCSSCKKLIYYDHGYMCTYCNNDWRLCEVCFTPPKPQKVGRRGFAKMFHPSNGRNCFEWMPYKNTLKSLKITITPAVIES